MPKEFIKNKPVISLAIFVGVCVGLGMVVTRVQANIQTQAEVLNQNPHQLPDEFNPKLHWVEQKILVDEKQVKDDASETINLAKEEPADEQETIHAIAMKGNNSLAKPIYDYTTGTSN